MDANELYELRLKLETAFESITELQECLRELNMYRDVASGYRAKHELYNVQLSWEAANRGEAQ